MAIEGYYRSGFNLLPAPHVQALVRLPRLGKLALVDFLIDTGADNTCIHIGDVAKLEIDYRRLRKSSRSTAEGVGGSLDYYREPGFLVFNTTNGETQAMGLDIHICQRSDHPSIQGLPSLLGRDFLNLCNVTMNKSNSECILEPLNVDHHLILPPP